MNEYHKNDGFVDRQITDRLHVEYCNQLSSSRRKTMERFAATIRENIERDLTQVSQDKQVSVVRKNRSQGIALWVTAIAVSVALVVLGTRFEYADPTSRLTEVNEIEFPRDPGSLASMAQDPQVAVDFLSMGIGEALNCTTETHYSLRIFLEQLSDQTNTNTDSRLAETTAATGNDVEKPQLFASLASQILGRQIN